jgi:AcrR family transcriptional regulator
VGNREALLVAARDCLEAKGYRPTTARDVAASAGVSLAAIGYHFGTTTDLLDQAVAGGVDDWVDDLHRLVRGRRPEARSGPERVAAILDGVTDSFAGRRGLLSARYEMAARTEGLTDGMRAWTTDRVDAARTDMARRLGGLDEGSCPRQLRATGALWYALVAGLAVQWLVDPARVMSGQDVATALTETVHRPPRPCLPAGPAVARVPSPAGGNRAALLAGARRCLTEKGYARTTARDVAAAAGVSLAAIGYHFGTTRALLDEAVLAGLAEWTHRIGAAVHERVPPDLAGLPRFVAVWDTVQPVLPEFRGVLASTYEMTSRFLTDPDEHARIAARMHAARLEYARHVVGVDPDREPERAWRMGSFYYLVISGLVSQWLIDPGGMPAGDEIGMAITVTAGLPAR